MTDIETVSDGLVGDDDETVKDTDRRTDAEQAADTQEWQIRKAGTNTEGGVDTREVIKYGMSGA